MKKKTIERRIVIVEHQIVGHYSTFLKCCKRELISDEMISAKFKTTTLELSTDAHQLFRIVYLFDYE